MLCGHSARALPPWGGWQNSNPRSAHRSDAPTSAQDVGDNTLEEAYEIFKHGEHGAGASPAARKRARVHPQLEEQQNKQRGHTLQSVQHTQQTKPRGKLAAATEMARELSRAMTRERKRGRNQRQKSYSSNRTGLRAASAGVGPPSKRTHMHATPSWRERGAGAATHTSTHPGQCPQCLLAPRHTTTARGQNAERD